MRKLVALMHTSLDGRVAGPQGELDWIRHGDEVWNFVDLHINNADSGIYGPVTFGMMESHWPSVLKDSAATGHQASHAQWYARAAKYVCSRRLTQLVNPAATLFNDNLTGQIQALKQQPGKNLILFGSPGLLHTMTQLDLVDEYVLTISPVVLGSGVSLFQEGTSRFNLKLNDQRQFASGCLGLHYIKEPVR